jgi:tyrosinase
VHERHDIWELSEADPWDPTIEWYARAVAALQEKGFSDPTGWRYLAAIHGTDDNELPRSLWPRGATWDECQHFSWFFLPWHRIYLHYFEQVVRRTVADLGGPDDWALPYWDYSDPNRPDVRKLPPAFREQRTPSGDPNSLLVERTGRVPSVNEGAKLWRRDVSLDAAMAEQFFTGPGGIAEFGGPATGWNHAGGTIGTLEGTPHGNVHVRVGGFMGGFDTAGLDPVFWLHHANIDRLWEVWLGQQGGRANPTQNGWLNAWFKIGSGASAVTLRVRDVLDTRQPPLEYFYSNVSLPEPVRDAVIATLDAAAPLSREEEPMPRDISPEMVGASEESVALAATPTEVEVAVGAPAGPAFFGDAGDQPRKVYLKVENIVGTELTAPNYLVHVDVPPGEDPTEYEDRLAGQVPMFGVRESSRPDDEHGGSGLTFSFDITGVVRRLRDTGEWDPERLRVTFTPDDAGEEKEGDVSVGRVSLFYA